MTVITVCRARVSRCVTFGDTRFRDVMRRTVRGARSDRWHVGERFDGYGMATPGAEGPATRFAARRFRTIPRCMSRVSRALRRSALTSS
jgi:hypothetical protein